MEAESYGVGDYQKMDIAEKIDFLCKVHREEISLWDDDGNDNEIYNDYFAVQNELLEHSEVLGCEDVLHIMRIFDDDCFEITWQFHLATMIFRNCLHYGKSRIVFYLQHLEEVPLNGIFHGWHFPVQWLMGGDSFSVFKEAAGEQEPKVQKLVSEILDDIDIYQTEKEELKAVLGCGGQGYYLTE